MRLCIRRGRTQARAGESLRAARRAFNYPGGMTFTMRLREVEPGDLDAFFLHQQDQDANHMAAFGAKNPNDRGVFDLHWAGILNDEKIRVRTIEVDGEVAGTLRVEEARLAAALRDLA